MVGTEQDHPAQTRPRYPRLRLRSPLGHQTRPASYYQRLHLRPVRMAVWETPFDGPEGRICGTCFGTATRTHCMCLPRSGPMSMPGWQTVPPPTRHQDLLRLGRMISDLCRHHYRTPSGHDSARCRPKSVALPDAHRAQSSSYGARQRPAVSCCCTFSAGCSGVPSRTPLRRTSRCRRLSRNLDSAGQRRPADG
jgi:hypothetical protein